MRVAFALALATIALGLLLQLERITSYLPKVFPGQHNIQYTNKSWASAPSGAHVEHNNELVLTLEYRNWELESLDGRCSPPDGVPRRCCLGSSSAGGGVDWDDHYKNCAHVNWTSPILTPSHGSRDIDAALRGLQGRRMAFLGDSMMFQTAIGFECELLRNGWTIIEHSKEDRDKEKWRFGIGSFLEWQVSKGDSSARFSHYAVYRFLQDFSDVDEALGNSDVLVLNFGVHWMENQEYLKDMKALFTHLLPHMTTHTIVWKETYAQHHDKEGGEYEKGGDAKTKNCVDVVYGDRFSHMWRDNLVLGVAADLGIDVVMLNETAREEIGTPALYWLPAHDESRRWLEFHKINPKGHCEATHVCYTPYLWTPLWGLLAEAVARSATTNKKTSLRD